MMMRGEEKDYEDNDNGNEDYELMFEEHYPTPSGPCPVWSW